ncbi:MAG TPA: ATP-binding protein [Methylomusa anaerophila]|uniref:histidine kinase n=1 Tax=Methylomusa anaerophila TaxID=1930071 RepID=A0A348AM97_9FIRM|nr:ATP-binding protein [Methylomusa anaerophila]BBB92195.1 sensor protein SrrB [Methylomusa anaerophila]HML87791.1 ATP-binding protein [Methylomusa anaerophila]
MFRKTLLKLTALNSIVFFIIFIVSGAMLYGYVANQLLDNVDRDMRQKSQAFRVLNGRPGFAPSSPGILDPRIFILVRDTEGNIMNPFSFPFADMDRVASFLPGLETGAFQTRKINEHVYRMLSQPYARAENIILPPDGARVIVQEVLAVSIVDSEVSMLRHLMVVILTDLITGTLVIVLAGYFLARRALIPIQVAWDKQQQFVADASHELRTPLAVIKSNAELMLRHPEHSVEDESIKITSIIREAIRMRRLVSTLLTLARADANQAELHFQPVNLNKTVTEVAGQFYPLAEMKDISLQVNIVGELRLTADKERLHQLLVILLDNAVKYTLAQGNIAVSCCRQSGQAVISVKDTGAGIAPEELPRIFDRFYRGDKARSREDGGTGLGLAIAKWIVEKHGGKIRMNSQVGIGTEVVVTLPLSNS